MKAKNNLQPAVIQRIIQSSDGASDGEAHFTKHYGAVHGARRARQTRGMPQSHSRARSRATQCGRKRVTTAQMDGRPELCFRAHTPFAACATLGHLGPLWATLGRSRPE